MRDLAKSPKDYSVPIAVGILSALAMGIAVFRMTATMPDQTAIQYLEDRGYSHINLGGRDRTHCPSASQDIARQFGALNADGRPVRGTVCSTAAGAAVTVQDYWVGATK